MAIRIGVQLHPQHCTYPEFIEAVEGCDRLGVDTLWTWDHFYPLYGEEGAPMADVPPVDSPRRGDHFEAWTLLTAMACRTTRAEIGLLVGCNSYRNPHLVADMARTVDHISNGRLILGLGSGWFERDYQEYGYEFGTAAWRLKQLGENLPIIQERLKRLTPQPIRNPLPIMIGGGGEKVTLKLVARHAHLWNGFGPPENFAHKNKILDQWCAEVGRNPREVERTVGIMRPDDLDKLDDYVAAGAEHIILMLGWPFPLAAVQKLLEWRASRMVRA
ncbi:LLM class F420-dependent oxidoreductase [bacterium CPR1]|nr:LLM class F420-dependent oxidoreductase [bacterium CPR1]